MAKIEPFRGVHYNPEVIDDFSKVVCPPYDVIEEKRQEECYQRSPYNIIRLILGKELAGDSSQENKYYRAAGYLEDWLRRGVLVQDKEPCLYVYQQIFKVEGVLKRRTGFISLLRLEADGESKTVYPHEHTHEAPKEDRLNLIRRVEANLSPIFTVFSDDQARVRTLLREVVAKDTPLFQISQTDGVENRIWRVSEKSILESIKKTLAEKEIFIADGHHRYEVARVFRGQMRQKEAAAFKDSYNFVMTFFLPLEDEGVCILPTHRLVKDVRLSLDPLKNYFTVKEVATKGDLRTQLRARDGESGVFGLYTDGKSFVLRLSERRAAAKFIQEGPKAYKALDVVILQKVIFDQLLKIDLTKILYEVDQETAIAAVDSGVCTAAFLLNPTKIEQVRSVALSDWVMPQKSTFFYPKLLSGLLINKF